MLNSESVLEKEMHKPFWDFEIQTNLLISARWTDQILIKKKKKKKERKKRRKLKKRKLAE